MFFIVKIGPSNAVNIDEELRKILQHSMKITIFVKICDNV